MSGSPFPIPLPASPLVKNIGTPNTIGTPLNPAITRKYDVHLQPYQVQRVEIAKNSQVTDWGANYLKAKQAHLKTRGESNAIFILDTAGRFDHPDLQKNSLQNYAQNFTDEKDFADKHGHGTHCAGLAAAIDNQQGVLGMAPEAKLVPIKVLNSKGSGTWEGVASAIEYVTNLKNFPYKKIISLSLGGGKGDPLVENAIKAAIASGVFVVAAAGNNGWWGKSNVDYPGKYDNVLTIASIGPQGKPSSFSSGGTQVDVAAPGEKNLSTGKGNTYVRMSGTSMATPHVAGVIALILSTHPEITNQLELIEFLKKGATDLHTDGNDLRTGAGAPVLTGYGF
ncbi:hypothetical protein BVY03_02975 [bacterium K02(2017)]|nr:hypothetical protein BVY03_02975 [bacterium K02(2017)]